VPSMHRKHSSMVAGAGSTGGILALCIGKFRNFVRVSSFSLFQKKKEK
jgi:hypothetical protein